MLNKSQTPKASFQTNNSEAFPGEKKKRRMDHLQTIKLHSRKSNKTRTKEDREKWNQIAALRFQKRDCQREKKTGIKRQPWDSKQGSVRQQTSQPPFKAIRTDLRLRMETENLLRRCVQGWCRNWGLGAKKAYRTSLWIILSSCITACVTHETAVAWQSLKALVMLV